MIRDDTPNVTTGYEISRHFPARPPVFVNRVGEVDKILRYLSPIAGPMGVCIFGSGGMGKTTLAIEAAYRAWERGDYTHLLFLSAKAAYWNLNEAKEESLSRQGNYRFASYSGMLGKISTILDPSRRPLRSQKTDNDKLEWLNTLLKNRNILFVIDNIDSISNQNEVWKFERFINFGLYGTGSKAIVTTRYKMAELVDNGLIAVSLNDLTPQSSFELLLKLSNQGNVNIPSETIQTILEDVHGNPLLIEQLINFVAAYGAYEAIDKLRTVRNEDLLRFLFSSAISHLESMSKYVLYTVALATYLVNSQFLIDVLQTSSERIKTSLLELKNWSLLVERDNLYGIHPLLEEYIVQVPKRDIPTWESLKQRVHAIETTP